MSIHNLPATVNIANAKLPATYNAAKVAIADCTKIDECKSWADKMSAIASYARMADDDALMKQATKLRGWAVRRCGELLEQFDGRGGDKKSDDIKTVGARSFDRLPTKAEVGEAAGMSDHQIRQATNVANVPADLFERAIEADNPATVTQLAEMGTKKSEPRPMPAAPPGYAEATQVMGVVKMLYEMHLAKHTPAFVAQGVEAWEVAEARDMAGAVAYWLDEFIEHLKDVAA